MADEIKLKGGNGDVPKLSDREPAYSRTEKALYVGTPNGNEKVGDANWETRLMVLENKSWMFYAVYGETPLSEIREAYAAGFCVAVMLPDGKVLYLAEATEGVTGLCFLFAATDLLGVTTTEITDAEEGLSGLWSDIQTQPLVTKEYVDGLVQDINTRIDELSNG